VYVIKQTVAPKSQPVGSQFTFSIEVGVRGLATAVARNVVLEDELPPGLLLDSAQETTEPGEKGEGIHSGDSKFLRLLDVFLSLHSFGCSKWLARKVAGDRSCAYRA
jgi:hypothetical protein